MNIEQWEQLKELFDRALARSDAEREILFEEVKERSPSLAQQLRQLVIDHELAGTFLESSATVAAGSFSDNQIIAHRYRIVRKIGQGGMGEVYEAIDTELGDRIALKTMRPDITGGVKDVTNLIQELQLARKITHPNVCRLYDVGRHRESGVETVFLTMELLTGQTLAARLKETGPFRPEDCLPIATQLATALDAAHASGVIHRDLKPANIMISEHDRVVITDFGVARQYSNQTSLTNTAQVVGTPAYMAPEQLAGRHATTASDIYSLGAVLYEALTGKRYSEFGTHKQTQGLDPVPSAWRSVIAAMTDPNPLRRPQNALKAIAPVSRGQYIGRYFRRFFKSSIAHWKTAALVGSIAALVATAPLWLHFVSAHRPVLNAREWILVTDVDNSTNDSRFDSALRQAFTLSLQQSSFFNVVPRQRAFEALKRRSQPADRIDERTAITIARAEGIRAVLNLAARHADEHYNLMVTIKDSASGELLLSDNSTFEAPAQMFDQVDKITKRLRLRLGESEENIARTSMGLSELTTRSPKALEEYSIGQDAFSKGDLETAEASLLAATTLDSDFATAHRLLATVFSANGNVNKQQEELTKAFQLRQRVPELERLLIEGMYYISIGDLDKALASFKVAAHLYPDDIETHARLAGTYFYLGQFAEGVRQQYEQVRLAPYSAINYADLIYLLLHANEYSQAKSIYDAAIRRGLETPTLFEHYAFVLVAENRTGEAIAELHKMEKFGESYINNSRRIQTRIKIYQGNLLEAETELKGDIAADGAARATTAEADRRQLLANVSLFLGDAARAEHEMDLVLKLKTSPRRRADNLRRAGLIDVLSGHLNRAEQKAQELKNINDTSSTPYSLMCYYVLAGSIALAKNETKPAEEDFIDADRSYPSYVARQMLGDLFYEKKELDKAVYEWKRALELKDEMLEEEFPADLAAVYRRLEIAARERGNDGESQSWHEQLPATWVGPNREKLRNRLLVTRLHQVNTQPLKESEYGSEAREN
jgi:serine/threonine protein kinase